MSAEKKSDSLTWSLIVGLTIILAGVTGFMVVNSQEFFPEMYKQENHEPAQHKAKSDTVKTENSHGQH